MIPQEKELIQSVLDRLASISGAPKDAEADAFISDRLRSLPDAGYNLVQAVVVQELGIKQAERRIAELEKQLADAKAASSQQPAKSTAGSFIPSTNPWTLGNKQPAGSQRQPAPQYQQPPSPQPPAQYGQQPSTSPWNLPGAAPAGGGGFLRNAATAAVGVAGGMLLAEGISSLFSGNHGGMGGGAFGGGMAGSMDESVTENVTINNYYGDSGSDADTSDTDDSDSNVSDDGNYGTDNDVTSDVSYDTTVSSDFSYEADFSDDSSYSSSDDSDS